MDSDGAVPQVTRRALIRTGLAGSALLALGGVGLELQSTAPTPLPDPLFGLTPRTFRVLTAVADRICPGNGDTLPSASAIGVVERADELIGTLHPTDRDKLNQALGLLESPLAGLLLGGRLRPFTRLSPDQQDAVLVSWRDHRWGVLQQAYLALRNLVVSTYHVDPRVFAGVGYPGPPDYGQAEAPAVQPRQAQQETG